MVVAVLVLQLPDQHLPDLSQPHLGERLGILAHVPTHPEGFVLFAQRLDESFDRWFQRTHAKPLRADHLSSRRRATLRSATDPPPTTRQRFPVRSTIMG